MRFNKSIRFAFILGCCLFMILRVNTANAQVKQGFACFNSIQIDNPDLISAILHELMVPADSVTVLEFFDMNRDNRPDLVQSTNGGEWKIYWNNGFGFERNPEIRILAPYPDQELVANYFRFGISLYDHIRTTLNLFQLKFDDDE